MLSRIAIHLKNTPKTTSFRTLFTSPRSNNINNFNMTHDKSNVFTAGAGCFWGVEKAFQRFYKDENIKTRVGYTGGIDASPSYKQVCTGSTKHAEALEVEFVPNDKINYANLVEFFYRMHDPTTLNSQGPDVGTQYRSVIFYHTPEQKEIAERVTKEVAEKHAAAFKGRKIVTEIVPATEWYDAETYHQKYLDKNPSGYECPSHFLRW